MSNHQTVVGNATADPEVRFSQAGNAWVTFTVADNRKDRDGNETATFIDCKAFDTAKSKLASNLAESIRKGTRVIVMGRVETETWEKDGQRRSRNVLIVDAIGPDLRFATASVQRAESQATTPPPTSNDPWASAPVADDQPPF